MAERSDLFGKTWRVVIDTIEIEALDVHFEIQKSKKPEPNTCELTIYNLNRDHQAQLEQLGGIKARTAAEIKASKNAAPATKGVPCLIEAGYGDRLTQVWLGDLRTVQTTDDGPDGVTVLGSGDGEKAWKNARLHVAYGPKTPIETALRAIARALGVGEGNLSKVVARLKQAGSAIYPSGKVISGSASRALVELARSADIDVSIQDGALQFLDRGKALAEEAILLNSETGMIGTPTVDNEGILTVETMMIPDVRCGRLVQMDAKRIKGGFMIERARCAGETDGEPWGYTLECSRY